MYPSGVECMHPQGVPSSPGRPGATDNPASGYGVRVTRRHPKQPRMHTQDRKHTQDRNHTQEER
jgi:hypothetical protein